MHHFNGMNVALGTAAGKLFRVGYLIYMSLFFGWLTDFYSVMTITDEGASDLLSFAEGQAA